MTIYIIHNPITLQAIKFNEEHSHGSLVALAIAIIAIFAAVNFNKVRFTLCIYIVHVHESKKHCIMCNIERRTCTCAWRYRSCMWSEDLFSITDIWSSQQLHQKK